MHEALLYERQDDGSVICQVCPWNCRIAAGESGRCRVRQNLAGTLHALNYGLISAAAVEPVERRGVYHLFPGSLVLTLGGWGNNLDCRHRPPGPEMPQEQDKLRFLDPERAASFAVEQRCRGVAWDYQEPVVWLEYVLDSAKLARANGLYTLLHTNGFLTPQAMDLLGPYLDAYVVEILSVGAAPYSALCGLEGPQAILQGAAYGHARWRCHVEVHTPLIIGVNASPQSIGELAEWIRQSLGPDTPWHLWAYEPAGEPGDRPATPVEVLEEARRIGREAGLRYVYLQAGEQIGLTPTYCPSCGHLLIQREGRFFIRVVGIEDNRCAQCQQEVYLRRSIFK